MGDKEKEAVRIGLKYLLQIIKLNSIQEQKHDAVKAQNFELASKLRTDEINLRSELPTVEDVENVYNTLNK